jgi:hypothetical protein
MFWSRDASDYYLAGAAFTLFGVFGFIVAWVNNDFLDYYFGIALVLIGTVCLLIAIVLDHPVIPAGSRIDGTRNIRPE